MAPSDSSVLYALLGPVERASLSLYRTDDAGANWNLIQQQRLRRPVLVQPDARRASDRSRIACSSARFGRPCRSTEALR